MGTISRLNRWSEILLDKIATARHEPDIEAVVKWSKALGICAALEKEVRLLEENVTEFEISIARSIETSSLPSTSTEGFTNQDDLPKQTASEARQEASMVRDKWVRSLHETHNIVLYGRGKIYKTSSNLAVGVALANELSGIANKWFLGLPDMDTDIIVLLCRTVDKKIYDFVIPIADISPAWSMLARSNRQVKVHIKKEAGDFQLLVPRTDPIVVNQYIRRYELLQ